MIGHVLETRGPDMSVNQMLTVFVHFSDHFIQILLNFKLINFFCLSREDRYEGGGYGHQRGGGGGDYYHRGHARSYSAGGTPSGVAHVPVGGVRTQDRDGGDLVQPPMMTFKAFLTTQVTNT